MALTDRSLVCRDCGHEFIFSIGEQEFYSTHGLANEPKRCPECRANRRRERNGGQMGAPQAYNIKCSNCGVDASVPFEPTQGRPVYCRDCYTKIRESGGLSAAALG